MSHNQTVQNLENELCYIIVVVHLFAHYAYPVFTPSASEFTITVCVTLVQRENVNAKGSMSPSSVAESNSLHLIFRFSEWQENWDINPTSAERSISMCKHTDRCTEQPGKIMKNKNIFQDLQFMPTSTMRRLIIQHKWVFQLENYHKSISKPVLEIIEQSKIIRWPRPQLRWTFMDSA